VWVTGWGHGANDDSDGNAAALRTDGSGLVAGADTAVGDDARIGVVVGVGHAYARVADRASRADVDSRHAGIYGRMALGGLQLQAGAARSWHDIASRRAVTFPGFGESLRGDNDAHTTQAYLDASHDFAVAKGTLSPFVDLAHVQVRSDGFTEAGGDAALRVDATDTSRSFATAGVRGAFAFSDGWRVTGSLGWSHAFGGDAGPRVRESFAAGGDAFLIAGVPIADNAVTVEAGLGYQATPAFRINAGYVGRYASDARDQGGSLTMAWSF
jgi:fibronectin-binding autotransporter adhesin